MITDTEKKAMTSIVFNQLKKEGSGVVIVDERQAYESLIHLVGYILTRAQEKRKPQTSKN
jgi:hypothetical protein